MCVKLHYTLFLQELVTFGWSWDVLNFLASFSLKLFLNCSYFLIFLNSGLVARTNTCKMALRNICFLLFHSAKKLQTVSTASANVTSLRITLPAPNDQAKFWQVLFSLYISICVQGLNKFLKFSDQNFSLVIVLSLLLIFGQISAWVFL